MKKQINTEKYQIWRKESWGEEGSRGGLLILADEIEEKVYTGQYDWYRVDVAIEGDVDSQVERLNELKADEDYPIEDTDDLKNFLRNNGIDCRIDFLDDYAESKEVICFDMDNGAFFNLADCISYPTYTWWDGSNYKTEVADDFTTVNEVKIEDECYFDLDEWDGSNWKTASINLYHVQAYRIISLDGEKVEDAFLLKQWSQYQDDHTTARILTKEELEKHIKETLKQ